MRPVGPSALRNRVDIAVQHDEEGPEQCTDEAGESLCGWGLLRFAAAAAVAFEMRSSSAQHAATQQDVTEPASVPAVVAKATRQDVPIYVTGVGSVEAYQSVLIRARVDGTLTSVPVTEGQEVKQGDLIAVIDPRPYQAALDQATAKKAQDEAQLVNARLDLARFQSLSTQDFASRQQVDTQQALVGTDTAAVAGDQAAIEAAQLNLAYCYITSPVNGRVGLRHGRSRQSDPGRQCDRHHHHHPDPSDLGHVHLAPG